MKRKSAGALKTLLIFQKRQNGVDGYGFPVDGKGEWVEVFRAWVETLMARGREAEIGGVNAGLQPVKFIGRYDPRMGDVDTSWRVVDAQRGVSYVLSAITDPTLSNASVELLCVAGEPS